MVESKKKTTQIVEEISETSMSAVASNQAAT